MSRTKSKPIFLLRPTYLAAIKGSVDARMFRESHFKIRGKDIEVLEHGNLACAFYVSSLLKIFDLISELHTTVNAVEKDLLTSGWKDIPTPRIGCVVIYSLKVTSPNGKAHRHLGFYIGGGTVIDNNALKGAPMRHRWKYRPVERLLWHPKLKS